MNVGMTRREFAGLAGAAVLVLVASPWLTSASPLGTFEHRPGIIAARIKIRGRPQLELQAGSTARILSHRDYNTPRTCSRLCQCTER